MMETAPQACPRSAALRVVVAEDHLDSCRLYQTMLNALGHETIGIAHDGEALFRISADENPDLIIADISMPTLDGITATTNVWKRAPVPIVLISGEYSEQLRERAQLTHVMVYLQKPVTIEKLQAALDVAQANFEQYIQVRNEARSPRSIDDDWRTVYQAKQMLMKSNQVDEQAAFRRLQEIATKTNERISQAARTIVAAHTMAENKLQARAGQGGK